MAGKQQRKVIEGCRWYDEDDEGVMCRVKKEGHQGPQRHRESSGLQRDKTVL